MAKISIPTSLGRLLTGAWLILTGLVILLPVMRFNGYETILAILAIVAGILLIMDWKS